MNSFIGTKEAAKRLHISVRRVQALIAAGRLPAQKIGNSYAIEEANLLRLNGRKNGRPKPPQERTPEEWRAILKKLGIPVDEPDKRAAKQRGAKRITYKQAVAIPPDKRTREEWDVIIDKFAGSVSLGPDRSINKKYLKGFGRNNADRD